MKTLLDTDIFSEDATVGGAGSRCGVFAGCEGGLEVVGEGVNRDSDWALTG